MTVSDPSFIPITPMIEQNGEQIQEVKKRSVPSPVSFDFKKQLEILESNFPINSQPPASFSHNPFSCWIASPTNQKAWFQVEVVDSTTFEELFYDVMNQLFPETPSFSPLDYYFLWITPERITRITMGEYVCNFKDYPRFVLRHSQHGIKNVVVRNHISIDTLDFSLHQDDGEDLFGSSNTTLLYLTSNMDERIAVSPKDNGVSLNRLLSNEDPMMNFRLSYSSIFLFSL